MKILTAILDDGIYKGAFQLPKVREVVNIEPEQTCESHTSLSHGTICGAILQKITPEIELVSVKVLSRAQTGTVRNLERGLEWCLKNKVKLIHLSLGTEIYQDFLVLKDILQTMLLNGIIIVAAFSNRDIPSFPAFYPGVFGVRRAEPPIKGKCFALDENTWLTGTNAWRANAVPNVKCLDGTTFQIPNSNSFAAPVLTAHIYHLLSQNSEYTNESLQGKLLEQSGVILNKEQYGFNSFSWVKNDVSIPIVLITPKSECFALETVRLLREEGYHVDVLGMDGEIPLSLYSHERLVTRNLVNGIASIYNPDILFAIVGREVISANVADAWIEGTLLKGEGFAKSCSSPYELKEFLIETFTEAHID
ncbi:S8 family serine peptidase [Oscillospiraceae bacterium 21-37]